MQEACSKLEIGHETKVILAFFSSLQPKAPKSDKKINATIPSSFDSDSVSQSIHHIMYILFCKHRIYN